MPRPTRAPAGAAPALRLEPENEWAWCGERRLELAPREFAVLRHLVERAGRLVTKAELLDAVWSGVVVSEAALTSCIRDLRRALADSSRVPVYIETVHRRGFRFIGPVAPADAAGPSPRSPRPDARADVPTGSPRLVGRDAELGGLRDAFAAMRAGRRRVVFVTGEPGIGKTSLVEAFLGELAREHDGGVCIGRGQCVEQFGAGEAYLPILEALGRLGRGPGGERVVATLRRHAPAWLAHLPGLLGDDELAAVQRRAQATTRERSLRELAEALDAIAGETPLVLVLEDLHWSDSATIDLLAILARRREQASILVVGTYRPADVAAAGHPLQAVVRELRLHGFCKELVLDFLPEAAIRDYLDGRFPTASFPQRLAHVLEQSTSGNPLFLVSVVDDLIAQGSLRELDGRWTLAVAADAVAATSPPTLWQMVEKQIDRLTPREQEVLAVASIAGVEFAAALAVPEGVDPLLAEEICEALARQGRFLRRAGVAEWPDGAVTARYRFIHALYRTVLYSGVPIGSRVGLHLRIGSRLERAHGARCEEVAGQLATHFEHGRDFERAVVYRRTAADSALRRHAHREAADHARRGLAAAAATESAKVPHHEVALNMILAAALIADGWASLEVERTYARARELSSRVAAVPERFPVLIGLFGYYITRAELAVAGDVARQMLAMAPPAADAAVSVAAHYAAGTVAIYEGDLAGALGHVERALAGYDPAQHSPICSPAYWGGQDVGVTSLFHAAFGQWLLGFPDRAAALSQEGFALARALDHPFTLAFACHFASVFHQARGDVDVVRSLEEPPAIREDELGIGLLATLSDVRRGWLLCEDGRGEEGVEAMRAGIAAFRAHGSGFGVPTYLALLAEAYGKLGRPADGLAVVRDARGFCERTGLHYWDAELERLAGELTLAAGSSAAADEAEERFVAALDLARRQGARLLELRAATSLARLLRRRRETARARALLTDAYAGFTEGFATRDLCEARALLDALARDGAEPRARPPRRRR